MKSQRIKAVGDFIANYASLLCLIDCVVLPAIIAIAGCLNLFSNFEKVEYVAHILELALVIPLGTLAVAMNYKKVRDIKLALLGVSGLIVILISHFVHIKWLHTILSLCGCALLITSNLLASRKRKCNTTYCPDKTLII